ncbi:MAG: FAD-binding oxidoreductase [Acidobacteriota bacterium]
MHERRRKFWGWGWEGEGLTPEELKRLDPVWAKRLGVSEFEVTPPPTAEEISLRPPRIAIPSSLKVVCTTDHYERLTHSYGRSFADSVRIFQRDFSNPPDVVALPATEQDIVDIFDWCVSAGAAAIPYGGGSSVVGGVEPPQSESYGATVTIDLRNLNRVLEIDPVSEAARIQAGSFGPALEAQLKSSGLTLRHFPQSFEFSTLGGWIATRSGGHFATLHTHIDELVESLRVVTPRGVIETRRLPGDGAGPSADRLLIGSEGIFGIITEAWMRLRKRPTFRAGTTVKFADFYKAADAVRIISQAGLYPANCRLLDAEEAAMAGAGDGRHAVLVLAFESADHPLEGWMNRALEICGDYGGEYDREALKKSGSHREGAAGAWRNAFLRACYLRENLTARGVLSDTFETAITWERFADFHTNIKDEVRRLITEVTGHPAWVTCRFTHIYPDGPAPYFTFVSMGNKERLLDQFHTVKRAASDAVIKQGGTITHHHAVGRMHRPQYDRQRPELFADALRAAKRAFDPAWILNPGVLIDQ